MTKASAQEFLQGLSRKIACRQEVEKILEKINDLDCSLFPPGSVFPIRCGKAGFCIMRFREGHYVRDEYGYKQWREGAWEFHWVRPVDLRSLIVESGVELEVPEEPLRHHELTAAPPEDYLE